MERNTKDFLARRVGVRELADLLDRLESQGNRRDQPLPGDLEGDFDFWFDGGACHMFTGWNEFTFVDGTVARLATTPALSLELQFLDGRRVRVHQESFGLEGEAT